MSFLKANGPKGMSAPSPTPSNSSNSGKRKRPTDDTVYSQPQETGTGSHIYTQLTYTIEHLRSSDKWETFKEITDYLNVPENDTVSRQQLKMMFRNPGSRLEWNPQTDLYRYKPIHNIRNKTELKTYLQNQKSAQGLAVRELKDGWRDCQTPILELERAKEILVKHNTKDDSAKTVWINDKSLMHHVDDDFKVAWHSIQLPADNEVLRGKLLAAGLKPASEPKAIVAAKPKEKKKKAMRRGGKQTNTHMAAILKDYSYKRK